MKRCLALWIGWGLLTLAVAWPENDPLPEPGQALLRFGDIEITGTASFTRETTPKDTSIVISFYTDKGDYLHLGCCKLAEGELKCGVPGKSPQFWCLAHFDTRPYLVEKGTVAVDRLTEQEIVGSLDVRTIDGLVGSLQPGPRVTGTFHAVFDAEGPR